MKRILIIEDEPSIADTIVYALETEHFDVTWKDTCSGGRQIIDKCAPDLLILDVGLPDANGFDFCKELRKTSDIPIICLTARADEIDRIVGLEIGADDYVVKPFSPRELTARVKALLRRTTGRVADTENDAVPVFSVDDERMRISYFGEALDLPRYEYRLLKIIVESPGRIYSREQLMQKAWDEPEFSMERTVDAHIKSLRAKLRKVKPEIDPILTHRGMGYALREDW
jgi:two-component system, OmpR family, catabolic regulation response regulator CreB